jgi:hypothetical protein
VLVLLLQLLVVLSILPARTLHIGAFDRGKDRVLDASEMALDFRFEDPDSSPIVWDEKRRFSRRF